MAPTSVMASTAPAANYCSLVAEFNVGASKGCTSRRPGAGSYIPALVSLADIYRGLKQVLARHTWQPALGDQGVVSGWHVRVARWGGSLPLSAAAASEVGFRSN